MPRMMTGVFPFEISITTDGHYFLFRDNMPRRYRTDGRDFPKRWSQN